MKRVVWLYSFADFCDVRLNRRHLENARSRQSRWQGPNGVIVWHPEQDWFISS